MGFDINKLEAKSEIVNVMGQDMEINPLTVPELMEFMKLAEKKDVALATQFLAFSAIRSNVPTKNEETNEGMTDNEIKDFINKKLNSKALLKIITAARNVSGLSDDDSEKNQDGNDQ